MLPAAQVLGEVDSGLSEHARLVGFAIEIVCDELIGGEYAQDCLEEVVNLLIVEADDSAGDWDVHSCGDIIQRFRGPCGYPLIKPLAFSCSGPCVSFGSAAA